MGMLIPAWLKPRDDKFSVMLLALSETASLCAAQLQIHLDAPEGDSGIAIAESKKRAKELLADLTRGLCRTFVTPFDREDIQELAVHLYKIAKTVDKVRERIALYEALPGRGDFSGQVVLICQAGEIMNRIIRMLGSGKPDDRIVEEASRLNDLEIQGDAVLARALVPLFLEDRPGRELILLKDIHDMLEKVIDRYRDASDLAVEIVLKHS